MATTRIAIPMASINVNRSHSGASKSHMRSSPLVAGAKLSAVRPAKAMQSRRVLQVRADQAKLMGELETALSEFKSLPPSMKADGSLEASTTVLRVLDELKAEGALSKFGSVVPTRRNVFPRELSTAGILNQESIGQPSVRNDAAFLISVVGVTSVVAVAGMFLPGELSFFVPYLAGGVSIAVLAIGSTAPGLLQVFIDLFSRVFPDYRERMLKHEAGHFLIAYLCGVPITAYSIDLGKEHTDLLEAKLQRRIVDPKKKLTPEEVDLLALVSMAGVAAEGMNFDDVVGQNADLMTLQRVLNKSQDKLPANTQQSITRWAVWESANLLKSEKPAYEKLMELMKKGAPVSDCIQAIESV